MKKETIIAIILGIGAGIGIALFVIRSTQTSGDSASDVILDEQVTPTVSISTSEIEPLLISEPEDELVTDTDTISINGRAQNGSLVIVHTPLEEQVAQIDDREFSFDIDLSHGENLIEVTSYLDKNIDTRSLVIYYVESE